MPPSTAAASASVPEAGHCWPTPPQETLKHSQQVWPSLLWGSLLLFLGPGAHKVWLVPSKSFWWVGDLILNLIVSLLRSSCSFTFFLVHGVSFFGGFQHPFVDGYLQFWCSCRRNWVHVLLLCYFSDLLNFWEVCHLFQPVLQVYVSCDVGLSWLFVIEIILEHGF